MVESLRKLVSGNRRRFTDDEFSLDLTYIVPNRIIAMSYPSSGFESLYRNSIDSVSALATLRNLLVHPRPRQALTFSITLIGRRVLEQKTWRQVLYHQHFGTGHLRRRKVLRQQGHQLSLAGPSRTPLCLPVSDRRTGLQVPQR